MKTLLLIADAGSVPTPQFAAEKHWCAYSGQRVVTVQHVFVTSMNKNP